MIGGQVADLGSSKKELNAAMIDYINSHKTGKLITASVVSGGIAAGAPEEDLQRLLKYGEYLGLAFQSVDDLHDGDGYLQLVESKEVVSKIRDLIAKAKTEIKPLNLRAEKLQAMADFLVERIPKTKHVSLD